MSVVQLASLQRLRTAVTGNSSTQAKTSELIDLALSAGQTRQHGVQALALGHAARVQSDSNDSLRLWRMALSALEQGRSQPFEPLQTLQVASAQESLFSIDQLLSDAANALLQASAQPQTSKTDRQALLREALKTAEIRRATQLSDYFQDSCAADFQARTSNLLDQTLLQDGAVLYVFSFDQRTELVLLGASSIEQRTVAVGRAQLTQTVQLLRQHVESRTTRRFMPAARQLHDWLIKPLQPALSATKVLLLAPDGPVRGLPFAALHDGERFLVERYALGLIPGLSLTDLTASNTRAAPRVFAAGISQAVQGFKPLPQVEQELAFIAQHTRAQVIANAAFTAPAVQQALVAQPYRIVHVASHGEFAQRAQDSFILTYDQRLSMNALEQLIAPFKYRDEPIDLLTLSACQTASGDERAALGLAGSALKAGARSVLASLWYINDDSSMQLITQFYDALNQTNSNSARKAQSLRQAQLSMIQDQRYNHPGYWAAFVLVGNWN